MSPVGLLHRSAPVLGCWSQGEPSVPPFCFCALSLPSPSSQRLFSNVLLRFEAKKKGKEEWLRPKMTLRGTRRDTLGSQNHMKTLGVFSLLKLQRFPPPTTPACLIQADSRHCSAKDKVAASQ